jgi:arylsulfatase A-like enzyme
VDKARLTPRDAQHARDAYDDCLVALDAQLGALVEALRSRGVLDRTVLIVTADHGEQFGEHGSFGHGLSLFDEEARVPLLIRAPGLAPAGRVVDEDVGLRDLAATALDLSAAAAPSLPGRSLARLWGDSPAPASPAFSELRGTVDERYALPDLDDDPPGSWKSVVVAGWSYVRRGDGRESLYELASDPGQRADRRDDPAAAEALDACRRAMDAVLGDR